jgi:hypothetical protein
VCCLELYLLPFSQPLRSAYRRDELEQLHSLMIDKGLRLHAELVAAQSEEEEEEEGEEEAETSGEESSLDASDVDLEERKRLMPY